MKYKIAILIIFTILLCGCNYGSNVETKNNIFYKVVTDTDTCVEYLYHDGDYAESFIARLNTDGTLKLNMECLKNKLDKEKENE